MTAQGADIEIIESSASDSSGGVIVPNSIRINGQEILIPSGRSVVIHDISSDDAVTVTVTMLVRSLSIKAEAL